MKPKQILTTAVIAIIAVAIVARAPASVRNVVYGSSGGAA